VGEGYFWVLRPDYGDPSLPLFGLVGESSKVNVNVATFDQLMLLPYMTDDVAASIVDWRDSDSDITPGGAEDEYYLSLSEGYYCKNAPFETVEEVLLVQGAVPELLYGIGPTPPLGVQSFFSTTGSSSTQDVWLQRGLYDLLTVYSSQPATAADGTQRINITDRNQVDQLRNVLRTQFGTSRGDQIADAIGNTALRDVFDLYFRARLTSTELSQIIDYVAPTQTKGLIDVNTAPREVLLTLDSLEPADVDKLVSARGSNSTTDPYSIAWVADALGQKAVGLGNRLAGRSYQYSALVLAVSGNGRAFKLVRTVIDMSKTTPQIIYRRDLTDRGWPMDPQILASLRAGQGPGAWPGTTGSTLGGGMLR
jgi:type II secretory pathway component PulK